MELFHLVISLQTAPVLNFKLHFKTIIMDSNSILQCDILDIIFESRNKNYGAYPLRKFYNKRLIKSLLVMFFTVLVLCAFTLIPDKEIIQKSLPFEITTCNVFKEITKKNTALVQPNHKKNKSKTTLIFNKPVVKHIIDSTFTDFHTDITGSDATEKTGDGVLSETGPENGSGFKSHPDETVNENKKSEKTPSDSPLDYSETMPGFPGGEKALYHFLISNLNAPEIPAAGESIDVKIRVTVGYDGKLKDFEVIQDGGKLYNTEVIRVIKKMPDWVPGKTNGKNVSVFYTIPVKFVPAD